MRENIMQQDNTKELQNLKDVIQMFHKELDSVYEKAASGKEDIRKWHEKLLETLKYGFHISSDQLGEKGYTIDPERVDQIIKDIAEEKGFLEVSKPAVRAKDVKSRWRLENTIDEVNSVLRIELKAGNYIELTSSGDWDTTAFGYDSLRHVISCWADGNM